MRVSVDGVAGEQFFADLRSRDVEFVDADADIAFLGVEDRTGLVRFTQALARCALPGGPVWVVYPKGVKTITEYHVRDTGLATGLVDNKIARFSDTHTAMRFVGRRARR